MKRTNFFVGIGAQRTGTTWLGSYLEKHPQVGFSPIKELHYFDARFCPALCGHFEQYMVELHRALSKKVNERPDVTVARMLTFLGLRLEMRNNPNRYVDYFDLLAAPGIRAVGEITPAYSLLPADGFREILRLQKDAKFVFIMRNPVDRFWSQLRFHETAAGIESFNSREQIIKCLANPRHVLRTDYQRTLTELEKAVDPSQVCVLFYENLMNPDTTENELRKFTDFIQIDYLPGDLTKHVNVSKSVPLEDHLHRKIVAHFRPVYDYVAGRFPLPPAWHRSLELIKPA